MRYFWLRFCLVLALLCILGAEANAKGYAPVVTPRVGGAAIATKANADAVAVLAKVGGNVNATSSIIANIAAGVSVPAVVTGAITGAASGGAWGAAAGALGVVAVAAVPAISAWMDRAGVHAGPDGTVTAPDPTVCTVAPCYEWRFSFTGDPPFGPSSPDITAACQGFASMANGMYPGYGFHFLDVGGGNTCHIGDVNGAYYVVADKRAVAPATGPAFVPVSMPDAIAKMTAASPTAAEVQALVDLNFPPAVEPATITGPSHVDVGNTVKLLPNGATQTEQTTAQITYFPDSVKVDLQKMFTTATPEKTTTREEVQTTVNPDGTTSTSTVTRTITTPAKTVTSAITTETPEPTQCGLPGSPACKIDETGTPSPVSDDLYKGKLDAQKAAIDDLRNKTISPTDKGFFDGWSSVFFLPPLAACTPWDLPNFHGASMGSLDPCPVVDGTRAVMAYLWALMGLWWCVGMVREVV